MIFKTNGVVIQSLPYSQTSALVLWLTPDEGILRTLAKGAFRPKSRLLGQFDVTYLCELVYHRNQQDQLAIVREIAPLHTFSALRLSWRHALAACYACRLTQRLEPLAPSPSLFSTLCDTLSALTATKNDPMSTVWWYEAAVLRSSGHQLQLDTCARCARPATGKEDATWPLIPAAGGLVCPACQTDKTAVRIRLTLSQQEQLRYLLAVQPPRRRPMEEPAPKQPNPIHAVFENLLACHLDIHIPIRAKLPSLLSQN